MKDSAILELYNQAQAQHETSPEYKKLQREFIRLKDELENDLDPEQKKLLDRLMELKSEMSSIECQEFYTEAYILATRIMTEVYYNEEIKKECQ